MLRYLNLFIARSQLTDVVSAALLQTIDKTMLRAIVDIGTDQYITNAQDSLDVQRLAMVGLPDQKAKLLLTNFSSYS